jgi:hypothetical protein
LAKITLDCFEIAAAGVGFGEEGGGVVELGGVVIEDADTVAG